ncbi:hypothetical protein H6G89_07905 [Oscillatoria sp. FACHB-1407]|uniref:hypothetical protein n=1 Tax=Oscillatoria sp. FACHB-1407 TaxID=2692847 RepID=UPI0016820894|nr:hypothetical protein [Oscillatoria sp. FACHB-1407]MBD2460965.1 hypothetical protein [Oscillatoria sp. FACHB-1407]
MASGAIYRACRGNGEWAVARFIVAVKRVESGEWGVGANSIRLSGIQCVQCKIQAV